MLGVGGPPPLQIIQVPVTIPPLPGTPPSAITLPRLLLWFNVLFDGAQAASVCEISLKWSQPHTCSWDFVR